MSTGSDSPFAPFLGRAAVLEQGERVEFAVHGVPESKGSTRSFKLKTGAVVTTSDNPRLKGWASKVTDAAAEAFEGRPVFDCALAVEITFTLPRPAGHFGRHGLLPSALLYPARLPDLDKLVRGLLDGITQAGVWRDDSRVVDLRAIKVYGAVPGARVTIRVAR